MRAVALHLDAPARLRVRAWALGLVLSASCIVGILAAVGPAQAATPYAYVANDNSGSITPINTATNTAATAFTVGSPSALAISPDASTAWVSNHGSERLTPVTLATQALGSTVGVGKLPNEDAITPDGSMAYVANTGSGSVTPINLATKTAGTAIAVGANPVGIAITPDGTKAYVTNEGGTGTVTPINLVTGMPELEIKVGNKPIGIAITPDGKTAYVVDQGSNTVIPINTATNTAGTAIEVGNGPFAVAITPDGSTAYVANNTSNTVTPINTATNKAGTPINVGQRPIAIAITPDGSTAYVVNNFNNGAGSVTPINLSSNTAESEIAVDHGADAVAITPDQAPVASFTVTPGVAGSASSFDASGSTVAYGTITTYEWNFGDGNTATTSTPTVKHTYAAPGNYTTIVTETDSAGTSTTKVFTGQTMSRNGGPSAKTERSFEVHTLPQISTQPKSATVTAPAEASFSVACSGSPAPTVQWQRSTNDGTTFSNLAGQTTNTLSVSPTEASMSGYEYRAVCTNVAGTATSNAAALTVNSVPQVTTQPKATTVTAPAEATFTVACSGSPAPTVQWQVSTDGGTSFSNLAGQTANTLRVSPTETSMSGYEYRAVCTNVAGSATSNAAKLTVNSVPQVTTQPKDTTVTAPAEASFSVACSGSPAPTVQWQRSTNGGTTFSNLAGQTTNTLSVSPTEASMSGYEYRAVCTNVAGSATSSAATLTVNSVVQVTTQPKATTVIAPAEASFTVACSGSPAPTVQWQRSTDGGTSFSNLAGQTANTLSVSPTATSMSGYEYRAVCANVAGSATSISATLTVNSTPQVTTQPTGTTVTAPGEASFTVACSGSPAPTVQWQRSTDGGASFTELSGQTLTTLTLSPTETSMSGYEYRAVCTNVAGEATSNAATLTVNSVPQVSTQPKDTSVTAPAEASFSVACSGSPAPTVQWQRSTDGGTSFSDLAGQTANTLSISPTETSESGYEYRAVCTNVAGSATSSAAALTVNSVPQVSTQPKDTTVTAPAEASFTVACSGSPAPSVQWQRSTDGGTTFNNLAGQTANTLSISPTDTSMSGYEYRAVCTNAAGQATSNAAALTVNSVPQVTAQASEPTDPPNPQLDLPSGATSTPPSAGTDPRARVDILTKSVRVTANGTAVIALRCPRIAVEGCKGTITLRIAATRARRGRAHASKCARGCRPLGTGTYEARAGHTIRVRVHMASFGRRLLAQRKSIRVTLTATSLSSGQATTSSRTITLHARRRRSA